MLPHLLAEAYIASSQARDSGPPFGSGDSQGVGVAIAYLTEKMLT